MPAQNAQRLHDALKKHQAGDLATAKNAYAAILKQEPTYSQAWHLLGLVELQQRNLEQALDCIGRAITLDPTQAVYLNNYGAALLSAGRSIEALEYFKRAITIHSEYADAYLNLGRAERHLYQLDAAVQSIRWAIQYAPRNLEAHRLLGGLLFDLGAETEAAQLYQAAIAMAPEDAALWNDLANSYSSGKRFEEATQAYRRAIDLAPQVAEIWFNLGSSLALSEESDAARTAIQAAIRLRPDRPEWELREALLCPPVFSSATAVNSYCESLVAKLETIASQFVQVDSDRLVSAGIHPPLSLAFQGTNTSHLKEALASVVRPSIQAHLQWRLAAKPRVGFVVTRGHAALFLRCCQGLIEQIDNRDFDLCILCSTACTRYLKERLERDDLAYVEFADEFSAAEKAISAARCDVLYHWEVGTDSLNYLLPLARLAPVQCTSWGTQLTSGLREVDYYLSSVLVESSDADQFCSEKLVRLNCLPTYQNRINKPTLANRSQFGLRSDSHIYLCPQNLLKLHPDQDELFRAILDADPAGLIVLKETYCPSPGEKLRIRLRETMHGLANRVHFVPWQSSADYYSLLSVADVVLDPIYYSAGSSAYDLFSLDLPVITLPGQLNVSRYTQACYRLMGFTDLVVDDRKHYVDQAVRVASDPEYREHVRGEIRQRTDVLFETDSAVQELQGTLTKLVAQARSI